MILIKFILKVCVFAGRTYLIYFKPQRAYRLGSILSRSHDEEKIVFGTRAHADNVATIF